MGSDFKSKKDDIASLNKDNLAKHNDSFRKIENAELRAGET